MLAFTAPYREVLAVRDARSLIGASAASEIGDWLYNAALLVFVYEATESAAWVGAATICRLLPYVLLGPVGGAVADRFPRRQVLIAGDLVRLVLMLEIAGLVAADGPVWLVIALTALASAAGTASKPAAVATLPRLVGESRLGAANALLHTVQEAGIVAGPAIGALLLALTSPAASFIANAATFAVSAALVTRMRDVAVPRASGGDRTGALAHVADGLRTARSTPFANPLFLLVAMVELTYGAQTVQLVVYAEERLDLGAGGYGLLLAAAGVGGLVSAVFNARLASAPRVALVVVGAGLLACVPQLVFAATDFTVLAIVIAAVGGAGLVTAEVVAETALARIVPADSLGRVVGVFDATSVAAMITGAVLASALVAWSSVGTSLLVLGLVAVGATALCRVALRGLDELSQRRAEALASHIAVLERLPVAAGVPRLALEHLAAAAQLCPLPPGVDVVLEGAPAHAFYAVLDGAVVVHRDGQAIAHLGPGDHFGERGLLDRAPRNATVTTETDARLLRLEGDVLLDALQMAPSLRSALEPSRGATPTTSVTSTLVDGATPVA